MTPPKPKESGSDSGVYETAALLENENGLGSDPQIHTTDFRSSGSVDGGEADATPLDESAKRPAYEPEHLGIYRTTLPDEVHNIPFQKEVHSLMQVTRMRRDLLVYKSERITRVNNLVQISMIIATTCVTFLEALKSTIGVSTGFWTQLVPVLLSTYTGLAVSVFKFFKMDETKESVNQLVLELTSLLKRFVTIRSQMKDILAVQYGAAVQEKDRYHQELSQIQQNFRQETYVNFLEAMEKFDILMPYPELIRFKKLFAVKMLEHEVVEGNIEKVQIFRVARLLDRNRNPRTEDSRCVQTGFVKRVSVCEKVLGFFTNAFRKKTRTEIDFEAFDRV